MTSQSHLVSVPLEVLLQITASLTTPDYGNLRLTCKTLEAVLFSSFSKEFFTKRQFMLTEFSLQALIDISRSRLSSSLRCLIVGLERPLKPVQAHRGLSDAQQDWRKRNRAMEDYASHTTLINTGQDVAMLSEAISSLVNLETMGLRDFYSRTRHRDFPHNQWRSYGASLYDREDLYSMLRFSSRGQSSGGQFEHPNRCFLNLWRALAQSPSSPVGFEVILRDSALCDFAFHIPRYLETSILPVLAHIKRLFLQLNLSDTSRFHIDTEWRPCSGYYLSQFLLKMPSLEHLRLNTRIEGPEYMVPSLLQWLSQPFDSVANYPTTSGPINYESPPQPVELSNLRELDLGMFTADAKLLIPVIRKFRASLNTLSLHRITLTDSDHDSPRTRSNIWARFLIQISKLNIKLTSISLSSLSQLGISGGNRRNIAFKSSSTIYSQKWSGQDIQRGIQGLVDQMFLEGLENDTDFNGDDDSMDSMDDIDDMDDMDDDDNGDNDDDDDDDDGTA